MLLQTSLELLRFYTGMRWAMGSKTQSFDSAGALVVNGWAYYIPDTFLVLAVFLLLIMHAFLFYVAPSRPVLCTPTASSSHAPPFNDDIVRRIQEMEAAALYNRRL